MDKIIGDFIIKDELFITIGKRQYFRCQKKINPQQGSLNYFCQIIPKKKQLPNLQEQVEKIKKISNRNISKYEDYIESDNHYYIFMEEMSQGTLEEIMDKDYITENFAKQHLKCILNGLKGLHENEIVFVDLNPRSIFKKNEELKIGQINIYLDQIVNLNKTQEFEKLGLVKEIIPPEILNGQTIGSMASDLFATSCLYYKMLFQRYPFQGYTKDELLQNMEINQIDFSNAQKVISEDTKDFLQKTLKFNPKERLKWTEVYSHPLLQSLNIANAHMAQSMLMSISMSKIMNRQDLMNKEFDCQKNKEFYQNLEKNQQKQQHQHEGIAQSSMIYMSMHSNSSDNEEISQIKNEIDSLRGFFSEQRSFLLQEQLDFYLDQRNIYASLSQSLTYVRLFDNEFKIQLFEFIILKVIYIISNSLIQQLTEIEVLFRENICSNQNLQDLFKNLSMKIEKENSIIKQQFKNTLDVQYRIIESSKSKGKNLDKNILEIINDQEQFLLFSFFLQEIETFIKQSGNFKIAKKDQALSYQINLQFILSFSLLICYFLKLEPKSILKKPLAEYSDWLQSENNLETLKSEQEEKLVFIRKAFPELQKNQKKI